MSTSASLNKKKTYINKTKISVIILFLFTELKVKSIEATSNRSDAVHTCKTEKSESCSSHLEAEELLVCSGSFLQAMLDQ